MKVRVELFGIPRQRAGTAMIDLELPANATLGQVLEELNARAPQLGEQCFEGQRLRPEYAVNLDGNQFVRDPATVIQPDSAILIMSADAGG